MSAGRSTTPRSRSTRDGRILGVKDVFLHDNGAYNPYGLTVPINSQCTLLGPYVIPAYDSTFTSVFTNLTIVTPYRGAGRQHGVFVIERLLDLAAHELGIDPRRNPPPQSHSDGRVSVQERDHLPGLSRRSNMTAAITSRCSTRRWPRSATISSSGKSSRSCARKDAASASASPAMSRAPASVLTKAPRFRCRANGKVSVATGIGTQGQGHFTSFAQIVADQLGVDVTDVDIVTGDTDRFYWGAGTFASRGAVVAGNAVNEASLAVRKKALKLASDAFECSEEDLVLADGKVSITGIPEKFIRLGELAQRANPMRGAVKPGTEPGLESTQYFGPPSGSTANGVHAMIVEIDPETFELQILKYVVVHDCGTVINPMILAGPDSRRRRAGHRQCVLREAVLRRSGPVAQRFARRLSVADLARRAAHGARSHRDAVAAQSARHQGRGRGRRHSGRAAVRAGDRGCASAQGARHRASGNPVKPEPACSN